MEDKKLTTQSEGTTEEQISDETLEQVSGGNKEAIGEAIETSTVADLPEEGAGAKGHFFKFKKKKFFHHHLHHD